MKKPDKQKPVTEKSLFYWAFGGNLKLQLILLAVIILVVFARVLPLEMQKRIVNDSIALRNLQGLIVYCAIYLAAITAAGGLKLAINYLQTLIGERAMSTMRQELYDHIIHLPLSFFRTTQPGMVVSSLITELSSAGNFAGMAFAVPVTNVLTLVAFAGYLMWLNARLAVATLLIYPAVLFILPRLQKKANMANKVRVDLSRTTSSQIAESISGIHEVQVHGAYAQESRKFKSLTEQLKKTRISWSLFRFAIKTANNYFVGIGPFIIFIFGGYLVMHGQLELGAMIAFLSAQEKLYDPWGELIDFYQSYQDAMISYTRTMNLYNIQQEFLLSQHVEIIEPTDRGSLRVENLVYDTSEGIRLLHGISFSLEPGEHLAIVGFSGSGKSTLIQCIGKMYPYTSGSVKIDGHEVSSLSKQEIIQHIGYVSQQPFIFTGTIQDNLLYALEASVESLQSINPKDAKVDLDRMILVLQQVGLFVDVIRFGIDSHIEVTDEQTAQAIIRIRHRFRKNFGEKLKSFIEFYDPATYHYNSSIAANITFGSTTETKLHLQNLAGNTDFVSYLQSAGLLVPLFNLGADLAKQAVDLLAGLDSVDLFFKNSPVPADKLEECETVLRKLHQSSPEFLPENQKSLLLSFALKFTPSIHTMARISEKLEEKILNARLNFPEWCCEASQIIEFYNDTEYIHGQSILSNILFGQIKPGRPKAQEIINQSIIHLLIEEDYLEKIADFGLKYEVGNMGDRLSGGQRQKLAIARVLLKEPEIILMDEATSALDNKSQTRIQRLMETRWKGNVTVIAVIHRLDTIVNFDKIAVAKAGKIVEFGTYNELLEKKGVLHELIYGRR